MDAGTAMSRIMQLPIWTQQKRFVNANSASRSERGFAGGGRGSGNTASFGALRLINCCSSSFCRCSECAFLFMLYSAVFSEREASSVRCGGVPAGASTVFVAGCGATQLRLKLF